MEWFWYIDGIVTVLFLESVALNYAQYKGWIKFQSRRPIKRTAELYNWEDHTGPTKRAI